MTATAKQPDLAGQLRAAVAGDVLDDAFSRGRYSTDASSYQMTPLAVVIPKDRRDVEATLAVAREAAVPVTPRGAGTSQAGQTINEAIIIDTTRHMNRIISVDAAARRCVVEPGVVLDDLNRALAPTGLWFPVDISTSSRATIGGMTGNNACGGRSLRYGTMRDNVVAIDAVMADGNTLRFGEDLSAGKGVWGGQAPSLADDLKALGAREAEEVARRFPKVQRRVGGYNLDALTPVGSPTNFAHLLVGSEGTLNFFSRIELKLAPLMGARVMGVCHFGSLHAAVDAAQHLVKLGPIALELIDRTMLELGRGIPLYRATINETVRGDPGAVLIAEFADSAQENLRHLDELSASMNALGFDWQGDGARWGGVVPLVEPRRQAELTEVRKAGLNIMMSMKQAGKPVSFVEDCAVPLEYLADYTDRLTRLFDKYGTTGTWYAHASVGCLHVRPILNLKLDKDVAAIRAIAQEAFALVREFKGSHSGEHGDGIARSEFHEAMFGRRIVAAFEEVKDRFDPAGLFNPGKIVRPPRMDDRDLLRLGPHHGVSTHQPVLDWSAWPAAGAAAGADMGTGAGLQGAVEMCNNNGACRKSVGGAMCPSWRVTGEEKHLVRGRANTLRLALSGQLGADAMTSEAMAEAMQLCVSCKACRRECPTGVDMARMKIEVQAARAKKLGLSIRDRIFSALPSYAPLAAKVPWVMGARDAVPGAAALAEKFLGLAPKRSLPRFVRRTFDVTGCDIGPPGGKLVALFADTFTASFEPQIIGDAARVLAGLGYRVTFVKPVDGSKRRLCCGRTHLSVGSVDRARSEMERTAAALAHMSDNDIPVVGLEPSCLLTFRDEFRALLPGKTSERIAANTFLLEEFLSRQPETDHRPRPFSGMKGEALVHTHCHQKSFAITQSTSQVLDWIPDLEVKTTQSGCCGMAGSFGYQAETYDVSMRMAELSLLPAVRAAPADGFIVATGTSCRHQIRDGTGRIALHPAQVLAMALEPEAIR